MTAAHLLGGVDPFSPIIWRHPDVGHYYLGAGVLGSADEFVVVGGDADDRQVVLHVEECLDPLTNYQVVIS